MSKQKNEQLPLQSAVAQTLEQRIEAFCVTGGLPDFPESHATLVPSIDSSPELDSCPDLSSWYDKPEETLSIQWPTKETRVTQKSTEEHVVANRTAATSETQHSHPTPAPHTTPTLEGWIPPTHPLI